MGQAGTGDARDARARHGQQVAVVGGGGFYGRYLVADLLRFTRRWGAACTTRSWRWRT
jgi:hypothetical protein